ncbi:MAG: carboxypeptidase regulatory-like domain-containing protein [Elusimicrobia bacterium]|nr:carboxypeptidase regulatory-like domain-containing protein [Elusimicrobiota bacterium]
MRCPACQVEYPPETAECPKCGVMLAKWHSGKPISTPRLDTGGRSSPVILYGGLIVIAAAGFYYWKTRSAAPAETVQVQPAAAPSAPAEAPAADAWRFEGTVFNLRTTAPVSAAQVDLRAGGTAFRAVTDAGGNFRLDVPALQTGGYAASVIHPDYRPGYIEGEPDVVTEEFRLRMDCAGDGEAETLQGRAGASTDTDFMICPKKR